MKVSAMWDKALGRWLRFAATLGFLAAPGSANSAISIVEKTPENARWPISSEGTLVGLPGDYISVPTAIRVS